MVTNLVRRYQSGYFSKSGKPKNSWFHTKENEMFGTGGFRKFRSFLGVATASYDHFSRWVSKIRTATVGGLVKSPLICEPENETIQQLKFPISISQIAAIWGNIGITWNNYISYRYISLYFHIHPYHLKSPMNSFLG